MYNVIRIYNKENDNSHIIIGMNKDYKINEHINKLANKKHNSPILQKEFNEYKKQIKKEYRKDKLYKYINFDLLVYDTFYNAEILEVLSVLDFNIVDKYIMQYRETRKGYNQYTNKENEIYKNIIK